MGRPTMQNGKGKNVQNNLKGIMWVMIDLFSVHMWVFKQKTKMKGMWRF